MRGYWTPGSLSLLSPTVPRCATLLPLQDFLSVEETVLQLLHMLQQQQRRNGEGVRGAGSMREGTDERIYLGDRGGPSTLLEASQGLEEEQNESKDRTGNDRKGKGKAVEQEQEMQEIEGGGGKCGDQHTPDPHPDEVVASQLSAAGASGRVDGGSRHHPQRGVEADRRQLSHWEPSEQRGELGRERAKLRRLQDEVRAVEGRLRAKAAEQEERVRVQQVRVWGGRR